MGAEYFYVRSNGVTAKEAFDAAVEKALCDHGHAGYSGSIAEKTEFIMFEPPDGESAAVYAESLEDPEDIDPRIEDKWGPCGALDLGDSEVLFVGWASS